jgi:hypothetical protein
MTARYQPWKKGPADILPFAQAPERCWCVVPVAGEPGQFRGVLLGADGDELDGPKYTEAGPRELVVSTLTDRTHLHCRRGLPIVLAPVVIRVRHGQEYHLLETRPYVRRDGSETVLLAWTSACAECGVGFTIITPLSSRRFEPNRRCPRHKRPGQRVKGGGS